MRESVYESVCVYERERVCVCVCVWVCRCLEQVLFSGVARCCLVCLLGGSPSLSAFFAHTHTPWCRFCIRRLPTISFVFGCCCVRRKKPSKRVDRRTRVFRRRNPKTHSQQHNPTKTGSAGRRYTNGNETFGFVSLA